MPLRTTLLIAAVLIAGCVAPVPTTPAAPPAHEPATASEADDRYTLTLTLPSDTWAVGEPIDGTASLSLEPGPDVQLSGSGSPIAFSYAEVNGRRRIDPVFTADCAPHPLSAASPITTPLTNRGSWSDDMPDAEFYRDFFTGPDVRLPAGDWDIAVVLAIGEGPDCSGRSLRLAPSVRIHVTDAPATSP